MGSNWSPEKEIHHFNDCEQMGCPGHKIKLESSRSSDVITVWIDGKPEYHFDENVLQAIIELNKGPWR